MLAMVVSAMFLRASCVRKAEWGVTSTWGYDRSSLNLQAGGGGEGGGLCYE
jgi:hypothetical protein